MKTRFLKKYQIDEVSPLLSTYKFNDFRTYRMLSKDDLNKYLFNQISDFIKNKNNWVVVIEEKGEIVGLASLTYLLWDTKHFGFGMGRIGYLIVDREYIKSIQIKNQLLSILLDICKEEKIVHLSCRIDINDISSIHILERNGFKLMDTLVTFTFDRHKNKFPLIKELYNVRKFKDKDLNVLVNVATNAFSNDRFHLDSNISNDKADALYKEWIRNSCKRKEPVFVAVKKDRAIGFLTYNLYEILAKITNFKIMGQGLMAVSPGNKGALISLMKATFRDVCLHYDCVEYDTRLNNYEVIRTCQRFGLDFVRAKYTFHRWLKQ